MNGENRTCVKSDETTFGRFEAAKPNDVATVPYVNIYTRTGCILMYCCHKPRQLQVVPTTHVGRFLSRRSAYAVEKLNSSEKCGGSSPYLEVLWYMQVTGDEG